MTSQNLVTKLVAWLRRSARASEVALILLAVTIGAAAGLSTVLIGAAARTLQHWLFALPPATRLSALPALGWSALVVLPIGCAVLALFSWVTK